MSLSCHDLCLEVGTRRLLDEVELRLSPGQLTAIVGPNGAGKSTLMAALAGEPWPGARRSGAVQLDDRPLSAWRPDALARRRAWVQQRPELSFGGAAWQLVALGRLPWRDPAPLPAVERALALVDALDLAGRDVATLSGGEAARVHVARALAQLDDGDRVAGWLLLDEPTAALDLLHRERLMTTLSALVSPHVGVVVVLHDLGEALRHADEVILLSGGRVQAAGPAPEVLSGPRISEVWGLPVELLSGAEGAAVAVVPAQRRTAR